ncbi:hypothetical protein [Gorillibacterium sp. sgz5001074]|uniref:hypothetical protein n=1 Tax=Gorillibacterium sp. sgz5001074 TaxID=3446695 RepID=UPI003F681A47
MAWITHMNYTNEEGNVYCCLRNKVVPLNPAQTLLYCSSCTMFKGLYKKKVNCRWQDPRDLQDPHAILDPYLEYRSMQQRSVDKRIPIIEAHIGGYR